jgi:phosphotransferase system enzyme I (PtsI)
MEDPYLRERKADLEQVIERMLVVLGGEGVSVFERVPKATIGRSHDRGDLPPALEKALGPDEAAPLILVARDLSPSDLLQFKQSVFAGFVTDVGGKTSHTAIVARGLDIPAVVGARSASQLVKQDDWVIIDGDAGVILVDPSSALIEEYVFKQREGTLERERLTRLRHTPAVTLDGEAVQLMANIEQPADTDAAIEAGAVGVGLFRSEFLFMGRTGKGQSQLPDEEEQFLAYKAAVEGMHGMPVTIRTIDIGADKPLDRQARGGADDHLNPALGLRAIRWCLAEPAMFVVQLRAILRAAAFGQIDLLIPMLAHVSEIKQTLQLIDRARGQLDAEGQVYGRVRLGAMIEVPAAAMMTNIFLKYFDFLSIGTNDLIQYTLAIDRVDESVSHLYDPWHPAILGLLSQVIKGATAQGKHVSVCGEMAGDVQFTALLLGLGLRNFSMHPTQIPAVKRQILRSNAAQLSAWSEQVLSSDDPHSVPPP